MFRRPSDPFLFLWAGLLILVCLYPLVLFDYTLKWDALDITLPWRYFSCDALRQGILPLWNPFQFQGFAQGSEPQTWYPIAILFGLPAGYSTYSLNLEFVFHIAIALWGFIRLARVNGVSQSAATIGGVCFALGGFFIGNSQHFGWIVAGAWLPHIIASYQLFVSRKTWKDIIPLTLASFMLLTGGYIAFSLILVYILLGLTAHALFVNRIDDLKSFLTKGLVLLLAISTTCGLVLVGWWDLASHISRADGLEINEALVGSTYLKHLLSFLWPASTIHDTWTFWQADQSLINHYISIPGLAFALSTIVMLKDNPIVRRIWLLMFLALALSLGHELPIRQWANHLPGFSLFRFPSLFRYFTILLMCLLAAIGVEELIKKRSPLLLLRSILGIAVCFFVAGLLTSAAGFGQQNLQSSIYTGSFFGLVILLAIYLIWISSSSTRQRSWVILGLIALDLFVFIHTNGPTSLLSAKPFKMIENTMSQLPQGYPHPPLQDVLLSNPDRSLQQGSIYRNTNTLYKRLGWNGYTPYQYHGFLEMEASQHYRSTLLAGPLMLGPLLKPVSEDYHEANNDPNLVTKCLQISQFDPNEIIVETKTDHPRLLVYNQNHHPEWRAFVDDKEVTIHKAEVNLMAIHLPSGNHQVRFTFWPGSLVNALHISGSLFLGLLVILLLQQRHGLPLVGLLTVFVGAFVFHLSRPLDHRIAEDSEGVYNEYDEHHGEMAVRDRFLDKKDFDRYAQIMYNNPNKSFYDNTPDHVFVDAQVGLEDWTAMCTFGAKAKSWTKSTVNIDLDEVLNPYQNFANLEYGATYTHTFIGEGSKKLSLQLDILGNAPPTTQLVVNLMHDDKRLAWEKYRLPHQGNAWSRRKFERTIDVLPGSVLTVYVWNPKLATFGIDNMGVKIVDTAD